MDVPANVARLRFRAKVGIRNGSLIAESPDNYVAFRFYVNGVRLWGTAKNSVAWDDVSVDLPTLAGQPITLQLVHRRLGQHALELGGVGYAATDWRVGKFEEYSMVEFEFGGEIVWRPTAEYIERSHLTRFMRQHGIGTGMSCTALGGDVAWFTDAVLKYLDIQFYEPYPQVRGPVARHAWPRWCVGGEMNIVHNCLDK